MSSSSSTTERAATRAGELPERIEVGRVLRPHGIRGELVVESLSDVPARFAPGATLEAVESNGVSRRAVVRKVSEMRPGRLLIELEGVVDRNGADALRGARFEIARSEVPAAKAGEYWQFELLGCLAADRFLGVLGRVVELIDSGGGPLLVVEMGDGRRVSLPFVEKFVTSVDVAGRRIEWQLPEGLVEACASRS